MKVMTSFFPRKIDNGSKRIPCSKPGRWDLSNPLNSNTTNIQLIFYMMYLIVNEELFHLTLGHLLIAYAI